jgi:hypothetical protein
MKIHPNFWPYNLFVIRYIFIGQKNVRIESSKENGARLCALRLIFHCYVSWDN